MRLTAGWWQAPSVACSSNRKPNGSSGSERNPTCLFIFFHMWQKFHPIKVMSLVFVLLSWDCWCHCCVGMFHSNISYCSGLLFQSAPLTEPPPPPGGSGAWWGNIHLVLSAYILLSLCTGACSRTAARERRFCQKRATWRLTGETCGEDGRVLGEPSSWRLVPQPSPSSRFPPWLRLGSASVWVTACVIWPSACGRAGACSPSLLLHAGSGSFPPSGPDTRCGRTAVMPRRKWIPSPVRRPLIPNNAQHERAVIGS